MGMEAASVTTDMTVTVTAIMATGIIANLVITAINVDTSAVVTVFTVVIGRIVTVIMEVIGAIGAMVVGGVITGIEAAGNPMQCARDLQRA